MIFLNQDDFKKIAILKKGIGIKSQKLCKQVKDNKSIQTRSVFILGYHYWEATSKFKE